MTDGSEHLIDDPSMIIVAQHEIIVAHRREHEVIPKHTSYFRPLHITRLETVPDPD